MISYAARCRFQLPNYEITQLPNFLIRFVTRVGHEHPEYDEAMRRLSAHIATGAASQ